MSEVIQFHNLAHIFISLIGAILLLTIYYNIRRRFSQTLDEDDSQKRIDKGLLYLSLAMFVWVASGIWAFCASYFGYVDHLIYEAGNNLFSIVNNMFLLLALFYFDHAPSFIYNNIKNIKLIIGLIIVVTLVTFIISSLYGDAQYRNIVLTSLPDLFLSGFVSFLLLISFYKTFIHRGLPVVAFISLIIIGLIFISQLPDTFLILDNGFSNSLIKIVAKTSLISLFLVLATTWVIQLASTPRINEMKIKFIDWSLVQLSIPSKNINNAHIDFGSKTTQYKNLLKFAIRRKNVTGFDKSILIGPSGEIKNQTYLTRIIENINEILNLEDIQKLDRNDLFTFLGEGKYRLRMLPDHIEIDSSLLEEFVKDPANAGYQSYL